MPLEIRPSHGAGWGAVKGERRLELRQFVPLILAMLPDLFGSCLAVGLSVPTSVGAHRYPGFCVYEHGCHGGIT